MTSLILFLTLLSMFLPIYVYIGYPLILYFLTRNKPDVTPATMQSLPTVAMMVSCYNEADVIREKLENCKALDYPNELLEIIVISDGSDDGTDEIVHEFTDSNIKLIRQEGRLGKTSGLNLGVAATEKEIIVFSDANAMYEKDALKKLIRHFTDEEVGYVVGAALYTDGDENSAAKSENSYWQYEIFIKTMESKLHSVVGGDGAIYAIRRSLYKTLDVEDINDFVNPLQIIESGYRGRFDPEAICYEETAGDFDKEARRKERIVNRSFRGLMKVRAVMNPLKTGIFSFEVISHKLLRWLIPLYLLIFAIGSFYLAIIGYTFFQLVLLLEIIFSWLAIVGYLKSDKPNLHIVFSLPYYFLMVNYYSLMGIYKALKGDIHVTWSTPRSSENITAESSGKFSKQIKFYLIASMLIFIIFFVKTCKMV